MVAGQGVGGEREKEKETGKECHILSHLQNSNYFTILL